MAGPELTVNKAAFEFKGEQALLITHRYRYPSSVAGAAVIFIVAVVTFEYGATLVRLL